MSLYEESEKAASSINEILKGVKSSKRRMDATADSLTKALDNFHIACKPIYDFASESVDTHRSMESLSLKVSAEIKESLNTNLSHLRKVQGEIADGRERVSKSIGEHFQSTKAEIENQNKKLLESIDLARLEITTKLDQVNHRLAELQSDVKSAKSSLISQEEKSNTRFISLLSLSALNLFAISAIIYKLFVQ